MSLGGLPRGYARRVTAEDEERRVDLGEPHLSSRAAHRNLTPIWFASGPVVFYGAIALAIHDLVPSAIDLLVWAGGLLSTGMALYFLLGGYSHDPRARFGWLLWNLSPLALPIAGGVLVEVFF